MYENKNKEKNFKLKFRLFLEFLIGVTSRPNKTKAMNEKRVREWNLQVFSVETM